MIRINYYNKIRVPPPPPPPPLAIAITMHHHYQIDLAILNLKSGIYLGLYSRDLATKLFEGLLLQALHNYALLFKAKARTKQVQPGIMGKRIDSEVV